MSKILLLLPVLLALTACSIFDRPQNNGRPAATSAEVRATLAAQVDRGEQPAVIYRRRGPEEGDVLEWRIYANGRAATISAPRTGQAEVSETDIETDDVTQLLDELDRAGFFDVAEPGEASCCDRYNHVITVHQDGETQSLTVEEVTPQIAVPRLQSINFVERFIFEQITSAGDEQGTN